MTKKSKLKFNYCVGAYWEGTDGMIGTYTYNGEVFFGTLAEARKFRKFCQEQSGDEDKEYKIFQLVEIPE